MTSGGHNLNYFFNNQLTKFSATSLNNKSKQGLQNKCKSMEVQMMCERSQEKILAYS